jgi:hypothetical protein
MECNVCVADQTNALFIDLQIFHFLQQRALSAKKKSQFSANFGQSNHYLQQNVVKQSNYSQFVSCNKWPILRCFSWIFGGISINRPKLPFSKANLQLPPIITTIEPIALLLVCSFEDRGVIYQLLTENWILGHHKKFQTLGGKKSRKLAKTWPAAASLRAV